MAQTRNKPTHLGTTLTTRLSPLMMEVLQNASRRTGVTMSELVRIALVDLLMGDYEARIRKQVRNEGKLPGYRRRKAARKREAGKRRADRKADSPR